MIELIPGCIVILSFFVMVKLIKYKIEGPSMIFLKVPTEELKTDDAGYLKHMRVTFS